MSISILCKNLSETAKPLCRILADPAAAYVLTVLPPSKTFVLLLLLTGHRSDLFEVIEAISGDLKNKPFCEAVARIPAKKIHELARMVSGSYLDTK